MKKTIKEVLTIQGTIFDRIPTKNYIEYRILTPTSISSNGKIVDCGVTYDSCILVTLDDLNIIDITRDKKFIGDFISDLDRYAKIIGINTISDLIGLSDEDFNKAINKRYNQEN